MKYIRYILVALLAGLFIWGLYFIVSRQGEAISSNSSDALTTANEETPPPPPPIYDTVALQQSLQAIVDAYPKMDTAIAVKAVGEDISTNIQADAEYIAASTTKAIVATHALKQVGEGSLNLNTIIGGLSLQEHITRMIVDSSNSSWYALLEYFGYSNITAYANENGAPSFEAVGNTITPQDMSQFINNMHSGKLINQEHITFLEDLMDQAYTGPIKLDEAHANIIRKAGWLEDRAHLTGIIIINNKAVSYAIYTKSASGNAYSYASGSALINEVLTAIKTSLQ